MRLHGVSKIGLGLALIAALAGGTWAGSAAAQSATGGAATASKAETVIDYRIPAQPLASALRQFAEATGLPLVYDAKIAAGKQSGEVSGPMNANAALTRMLAGSGLAFTLSANGPVLLTAAASGGLSLGVVRVDGGNLDGSKATVANGINGSTDMQATEGTGSYTTNATGIATKSIQTLKDTPFAVSVITRQRLDDQGIIDLNGAMDQMTGVTTTYNGSNQQRNFYSRGFAVNSFSVDGSAPFSVGNESSASAYSAIGYQPLIDLSVYDSVQLERGAAGIFNGYGDPGGVINLQRKKPLDHNQVEIEAHIGSWENYRASLDATGPLGFDGKLRGRVVVTEQDNHYFYKLAKDNLSLLYVNLEADLTPTTRLSGGLTESRDNALPFVNGLPRYQNGADLNLPYSTCLCFPWSHIDTHSAELFAQLDQKLGSDWALTVHAAKNKTTNDDFYGYFSKGVDPVSLAGPRSEFTQQEPIFTQTTADASVNGSFQLFGRRQEVVVGANIRHVSGSSNFSSDYFGGSDGKGATNLFTFDPNAPANSVQPATEATSLAYQLDDRQYGAYVSLNLNPYDNVHVLISERYSHDYESDPVVFPAFDFSAPAGKADHNFSRPNLSVSYDLSKSLSIFGTYASIYQPQGQDLTAQGKPLEPIKGSNVEFGAKWASPAKDLNASVTAYSISKSNFPVKDTSAPSSQTGFVFCCYLASGANPLKFVSKGVDTELTGQVLKNWQMSFGYTYNFNKYVNGAPGSGQDTGLPLQSLQPKHVVKLFTTYRLDRGDDWLQRFTVGGGVNWQSQAFSSGTTCKNFDVAAGFCHSADQVAFSYFNKQYTLVQAYLNYKIDNTWQVSLNGTNLFNHHGYQTANGNPDNGNWYVEPAAFLLTLRGKW